MHEVALLAEGVDRNIGCGRCGCTCCMSPSSRRAWIEISRRSRSGSRSLVALLAEGVDRNRSPISCLFSQQVALLAEGVDRNIEL